MKPLSAVVCSLMLGCLGTLAGCAAQAEPLTICSYNVQNLFDGVSHGSEYPEFDPRGGIYGPDDYRRRLESLGEFLRSSFGEPPTILALQEVENRQVVEDLLSAAGWAHLFPELIFDPARVGSTGVAVASRLPLSCCRAHRTVYRGRPGRTILEVHVEAPGGRVVLFVNHWKSQRPSVEETEPHRLLAARAVAWRLARGPEVLTVVAGDLNTQAPRISGLRQPWDVSHDEGSYAYRGLWRRLDHILYVTNEGAESPVYSLESFGVVRAREALTEDGFPRRWIPGLGGLSDHLPVVATFRPTEKQPTRRLRLPGSR